MKIKKIMTQFNICENKFHQLLFEAKFEYFKSDYILKFLINRELYSKTK